MESVSGSLTGWQAWSSAQADQARERYEKRLRRLAQAELALAKRQLEQTQSKLADLASNPQDTSDNQRKRSIIEAAMARAQKKLNSTP